MKLNESERDELDDILAAICLPGFTERERQIARATANLAFERARASAHPPALAELDARCATLTAALEQKTRWADFLAVYLDENHDAHGSDAAWDAFIMKEHETLPVTGCECARCRAALAAAPQGGSTNA